MPRYIECNDRQQVTLPKVYICGHRSPVQSRRRLAGVWRGPVKERPSAPGEMF